MSRPDGGAAQPRQVATQTLALGGYLQVGRQAPGPAAERWAMKHQFVIGLCQSEQSHSLDLIVGVDLLFKSRSFVDVHGTRRG